ncbi:MAG TPA: MMPL family transporter, partial [Rhodothermales bacterium]
MTRLFRRLLPAFRIVIHRPAAVVVVLIAVSLGSLHFARQLRIETDFSRLLPADNPTVQALEHLRETVGGENHVAVVIQSRSFEANRAYAERLIPAAMDLRRPEYPEPHFTRVEFRKEPSFIASHALYFATDAELDQLQTYLEDEIEQARLEANPFYFDLDEDDGEAEGEAEKLDLDETYDEIVPNEWPISEDSTIMVVRFYPSGSKTDVGFVENMFTDLSALVDSLAPKSFDPEMEVFLGGRLLQQMIEIRQITDDVQGSFGGGVGSVLLAVMIYFFLKGNRLGGASRSFKHRLMALVRMPAATFLIAIPLTMSLTWTFAVAYFAFGLLNLMTSTLILVLFGLGIDYGIHFFARYAEARDEGLGLVEALEQTFVEAGPPIAVSAATTAVSLFVLVAAEFRGFSQFGFIAGTGIVLALVSMLIVLPALVVLFDRWGLLDSGAPERAKANGEGAWRFPAARMIVVVGSVAALATLFFVRSVSFEYRFNVLEPEFTEYSDIRKLEDQVYPSRGKRNPAYIVVDDPAEVEEVKSILEARVEADTLTPTVRAIEALQDRYSADPEMQRHKLERIAKIRELISDPYLEASESEDLDRLAQAAQTTAHIPLEDVPDHLKARFKSKAGDFGNFVLIYPDVGLSDGRNSIAFTSDVRKVELSSGKVYYAASTSLVASEMLRLMLEESPFMVLITFIVVVILMFAVFRSLKWGTLAMLPLVVGILWMLGIMEIFDISLNFYNLVVLPAILGIGNDCGVHMVHRYREEGPGNLLLVLRSSGEHITIGVLTTM